MTEKDQPSLEDLRIQKLMREMAEGNSLEDKRVKKIMEEQAKGETMEDKRIKKLMEDQSESKEDIRVKKLMQQQSHRDQDNYNHVHDPSQDKYHDEEPAPNDERLRVDQIESQDSKGLDGIGAISSVTPIRPIQAGSDPVNFADALEQWRYMSEQYRNKRLAKEKRQNKPVENTGDTYTRTYNRDGDDEPKPLDNPDPAHKYDLLADINPRFQNNYEKDKIEISEPEPEEVPEKKFKQNTNQENIPNDNKKYDFRDAMIQSLIQKLSSANVEIDPVLVEEHEHEDIEIKGEIIKVSDVMTKNVVSVIDSMTIEQVASIFNKRKITGVPVIHYQTKQPIGIITMSDIISKIFEEGFVSSFPIEGNNMFQQETFAILDKPIRDLMHSEIIEVSSDASVKETCNIMLKNDIHRVLVTENNKVRGIFTSFDAVRILAKYDIKNS